MPIARGSTLRQVEKALAPVIRTDLRRHLRLIDAAHHMIDAVVDEATVVDPQNVPHEQLALLARLTADLRSTAILVERGYILQAWSLAAGVLEVGYSIGYMSNDRQRTERWRNWTDMERLPWNIKTAIRGTFETLGFDQASADRQYTMYQTLCAAKHANPIIQVKFGLTIDNNQASLPLTPFYNAPGVERVLRIPLLFSARAAAVGTLCMAKAMDLSTSVAGRIQAVILKCTVLDHETIADIRAKPE